MPTLLKDLKIREVSSVDRGAGEGVRVMLMKLDDEAYWKREFSTDERRAAAATGAALPDGSFPIKTVRDLENAIHAYGRAKNKDAARKHIISRARSLGATDKLPEGWVTKGDSSMTEEEKRAKEKAEREEKEAAEREKARKAKKPADGEDEDEEDEEKCDKAARRKAKKPKDGEDGMEGDSEDDGENEAEVGKRALEIVAKLSSEHHRYLDKTDWEDGEKAKFLNMKPHERDHHIAENPDPHEAEPPGVKKSDSPILRKRAEEFAIMKRQLAKYEDEREAAAFAKRAVSLGLPEAQGETLRKAYRGDERAIAKLEALIKSLTSQAETANLFAEFGASGGKAATARDEIANLAKELRKSNPKLSEASAFTKIYTDPEHAELKKRYDAEEWSQRRSA